MLFGSRFLDRAKKELALALASGAKVRAMQSMLGRELTALTWTR
jgi:hypothetical protein